MPVLMAPTLLTSSHIQSIGIGIRIGTLRLSFLAFVTPRRSRIQIHPNLRFEREQGLIGGVKKAWSPAFAFESDKNASEGSEELRESSDDAAPGQGPPLLTILAGLLVFLFFCWIIGSLVTWILGLLK